MRSCAFCSRWFRNKQAVRRHLGYCAPYLSAEYPERPWRREKLVQCVGCVAAHGIDFAAKVTQDEMHDLANTYGACPICRSHVWQPAGWRRVPAKQEGD